MLLTHQLYAAGLLVFALGAITGAACHFWARTASRISTFLCGAALVGALLEAGASIGGLLHSSDVAWAIPSGIPYIAYSVRLDPLSSFFLLALSLLAGAVAVYSVGYLKHGPAGKNPALSGSLLHAMLAGLTLVFTASDVVFFLIAWEIMVVTSYFLVVTNHEAAETRRGGLLYILMSRAGTGMLFVGLLLLARAAGSTDFRAMHGIGDKLPAATGGLAFLLLFLGFGVKAGIIPLHIWLPAAHPVAPSNISALMSGIVIKTGIYGLARVSFDFYGALPAWAGMLVLSIGVISALLGVLYALMEHDLKRLLAYHSIENIGIILMGFGGALLFRSFGHPVLAAIALTAGLFHTLNHGLFKCLLFLGAGSVLHATHTQNMEEMGGLIRRMPATALYFLIGAIAISGLPPLNGFVSEWLTYQAMLAGFGATTELTRAAFPIAGALLALTAALAAACFVKAFGITFLALPRSSQAEAAQEVDLSMRAGMASLALACVLLGLGATWFLPVFDPITQQAFGTGVSASLVSGNGFLLMAGAPVRGTVSTLLLACMLVALSVVPLFLWRMWGRREKRVTGPAWDCGQPGLTADNEYTATAFSKPLRMIFAALFRPRREIQAEFEVSPYYPTSIHFESEIQPAFERHFYDPLLQGILRMARSMKMVQAGSLHAYLAYIFITLILLLVFAVRG
ncbi:MAG: hydrogenase 4 subunit B [Candidatus Sulfopaludibacter sp.]|nr:hydrogenase 4 subunit B [Candidatus Sulfopaludibacter sp.]